MNNMGPFSKGLTRQEEGARGPHRRGGTRSLFARCHSFVRIGRLRGQKSGTPRLQRSRDVRNAKRLKVARLS